MTGKPLPVTQPSLPPLEELVPYLERIWSSRILTNLGPLHQELEAALAAHLGVAHLSLFNNGTIALLCALRALKLSGEVVTTPYSFVATTHALLWAGLTPVFADIDPATFNLDPARVEAALTPRTSAILPVHCYGYPCDVAGLAAVAGRRGLPVVYDAAHAFDVRHGGRSLLEHGDVAVLSFHATKVFNTFEGGAVICRDAATKQAVDRLRNFGFVDEVTIDAVGLNGKMNEVQAAMGLVQLKHVGPAIARRRQIDALYRRALAGARGIACPQPPAGTEPNCGYFPVRVGPEYRLGRDGLYAHLREHQILARRYFHPLLSTVAPYQALPSAAPANLPHATRAAAEILCLPIFPAMSDADVARVAERVA